MGDLSFGELPPPYSLTDPSASHSPPPYSEVVFDPGHAPIHTTGRSEQTNVNTDLPGQSHCGDLTGCNSFNPSVQEQSRNSYHPAADDPLPLLSQLHTTENLTSSWKIQLKIFAERQEFNARMSLLTARESARGHQRHVCSIGASVLSFLLYVFQRIFLLNVTRKCLIVQKKAEDSNKTRAYLVRPTQYWEVRPFCQCGHVTRSNRDVKHCHLKSAKSFIGMLHYHRVCLVTHVAGSQYVQQRAQLTELLT